MSRKIRAGRAEVEATIKDRLSIGLKRMRTKLRSFAKTAGTIGAGLIGVSAGGVALFAKPIASASRLQETMNKFDVVFKGNARAVKAWSDQFADDVGRSEEQIARFVSSTQDLLVPIGFESGAAEKMSKQVTGLAIDLASFNNKSDDDAQNDLQAALTGSGEVMKKYGVILSEAAVKQELFNQGIDPKNATDQAKVQARMNIIMRGTTAAQGDAIRSAGSWANIQKKLMAILDNTAAEIGSALLPTLEWLGGALADTLNAIREWVAVNPELVQWIAIGVGVVGALGVALVSLSGFIMVASSAITAMVLVGGALVSAVSAIGAAIAFLATPVGMVVGVVGAAIVGIGSVLVAGAAYWMLYTESGQNALGSLMDTLGDLLDWGRTVFGGIYDALAAGDWSTAGNIMWTALQIVWTKGIGYIMVPWIDFKSKFLTVFDLITTGLTMRWNEAVGFIARSIVTLIDKANGLSESLTGRKVIDIDTKGAMAQLEADQQKQRDKSLAGLVQREADRAEELKKAKKAYDTTELSEELAGLVATAATARAEFDAENAKSKQPGDRVLEDLRESSTLADVRAEAPSSTAAGSFRAADLMSLAEGSTIEKKILKANEMVAENVLAMKNYMENSNGLVVT